jgi:hypothetical protein
MQAFENKEFAENFINGKTELPIVIDFEKDTTIKIPFKCWVESEFDFGLEFNWKKLHIKLDIENGSHVSISLNHPTAVAGKSTMSNMTKNTIAFISKYIPEIIIKDEKLLKEHYS